MNQFSVQQKVFLARISSQENEDDWVNIPGYKVIVEERIGGQIVGLAGVTMRHFVLPSLFIAVENKHRGKGIASKMIKRVLQNWGLPLFLTYYKKKVFLKKFYNDNGFKSISKWGGEKELCVHL